MSEQPDQIEEFLIADTERRREMADDDNYTEMLIELLGEAGLAQLRALPRPDTGHLSSKPKPNTIFVPGIMGSVLGPKGLGGVWWIDVRTRGELNRLKLNADGDDAEANIDVQPINVDYSYTEFLTMGLAHDTISIRTCAYDWRKKLTDNVDRIANLVDELQSHNGGQPINLVGHSMGGLMIRTALMERPELWDKIGRIVYIGTPHYGSAEIAGYLKGHLWGTEAIAVLGFYLERETFQTLYGPLALLPAPNDVYPDATDSSHPCANFNLYNVDDYELSFDHDDSRRTRLQTALDFTANHWRQLHAAHQSLSIEQAERQLMIVGVGEKTVFRLEHDGKWFGLKDKKHRKRKAGDRHRESDGRVSQASAELPGVTTLYVKGVHGELQNIPAVAAATFNWLNDDAQWAEDLSPTPTEALAGHLGADESLTAPVLSSVASELHDDNLLPDEMNEEERAVLIAKLESGNLQGFELTKIL